jgi:hypothetical protein
MNSVAGGIAIGLAISHPPIIQPKSLGNDLNWHQGDDEKIKIF